MVLFIPYLHRSWAAAATSVRVTQLMNSWGFSKLHVDMKIFVWIAPGSCMVQKASGEPLIKAPKQLLLYVFSSSKGISSIYYVASIFIHF